MNYLLALNTMYKSRIKCYSRITRYVYSGALQLNRSRSPHLNPIINPLGLETPGLPRFKSEVGGVKDSILGCVDHWKENHLYFPCWSVSS